METGREFLVDLLAMKIDCKWQLHKKQNSLRFHTESEEKDALNLFLNAIGEPSSIPLIAGLSLGTLLCMDFIN